MAPRERADLILKIKTLNENAVIPEQATSGAAGFDLCSAEEGIIRIATGQRAVIDTGIALEIPHGYEGQVRPRSGLAARNGITVLNSPGTIDSDYRGAVKVILYNTGPTFEVNKGDRIAQLVISKVPKLIRFQKVKTLSDTERGEGGLGSTGK